jgi:TfoX/Sxy family transcriptional regulator of competence genes
MPYDEQLADRIRCLLNGNDCVTEKKMFGGLAFMVNGHMCCGATGSNLVVRTGPEGLEDALAQPHARPMDFTGRPMKGFVYVAPLGYKKDSDLRAWIRRGLDFVLCQTPK